MAGSAGRPCPTIYLGYSAGIHSEDRQVLEDLRAKIWFRIDGAGATHHLIEHMKGLNTTRRTVHFTVGWKITHVDEAAIAGLPADAWQTAVRQDGKVHPHAEVTELTGLDERAAAWGVRLLVRRVTPSARDACQLTDLEKRTGRKYAIIAINLGPRGLRGVPGSHHVQFI